MLFYEKPNAQLRDYLKLVQRGYGNAVLAGGALRDQFAGHDFADVDIFVPMAQEQQPSLDIVRSAIRDHVPLAATRATLRYIECNDPTFVMYEEFTRGMLTGIIEIHDYDEHVIQVIGTTEPVLETDAWIRKFDFGFCQVAWDGKTVFKSDDYYKDVLSNTITLVNCDNNKTFRRSMFRYGRWHEKYKHCDLHIPPRFHQFIVDGNEYTEVID